MRQLLLLLCIFLAVGCSRTPPTVSVRGKVLVNNRPLRGGTIAFTPDERRGARGPVAVAILGPEGTFDVVAVRGWHRVTVAPPPDASDLIEGLERYRHPDMSGLELEVREGSTDAVTFTLEWNQ